jgi:hypothetical protein
MELDLENRLSALLTVDYEITASSLNQGVVPFIQYDHGIVAKPSGALSVGDVLGNTFVFTGGSGVREGHNVVPEFLAGLHVFLDDLTEVAVLCFLLVEHVTAAGPENYK